MKTDIGGLRINYRQAGEGALLVMLHGWGANSDLFAGIEAFAGQRYTAVSPDMPGFGKSEEPAEAYDLGDYADFARDFTRALLSGRTGRQQVVFLGHSHGGRTVLRLLSRIARGEDPGFDVPKAVLVDSAGIVKEKTEEQKRRTKRYQTYKRLLTGTGIAKVVPGALDALQRKFGSADYAAASPLMRQSMVKVVNTDLKQEMPEIRIPVLLIWGDRDQDTPLADGKTMEALMPEAGLAVIEGAGHYCFLDNPVLFNRILGSFLHIG